MKLQEMKCSWILQERLVDEHAYSLWCISSHLKNVFMANTFAHLLT